MTAKFWEKDPFIWLIMIRITFLLINIRVGLLTVFKELLGVLAWQSENRICNKNYFTVNKVISRWLCRWVFLRGNKRVTNSTMQFQQRMPNRQKWEIKREKKKKENYFFFFFNFVFVIVWHLPTATSYLPAKSKNGANSLSQLKFLYFCLSPSFLLFFLHLYLSICLSIPSLVDSVCLFVCFYLSHCFRLFVCYPVFTSFFVFIFLSVILYSII